MTCIHLQALEEKIKSLNINETFRGQPWSNVSGEWVYYNCLLETNKLLGTLVSSSNVKIHEYRGTHDGSELGLLCTDCSCAIMGLHPSVAPKSAIAVG